ncbi:hypothetical protein Bbelb_248580 [Branchiostoma belcheri]|nr:hypothetical protein Bbelb_248580 [Branchiostoma belcheri]
MEDNKSRVRGSTFPESELRKIQRQRKISTDVSASRRRIASVESCPASRQNTLQPPGDDGKDRKLPPIGISNRLVTRNTHDETRTCSFGPKTPSQPQARRQRKDTPAFLTPHLQQGCLKDIWLQKMKKQKQSSPSSCSVVSQHVSPDDDCSVSTAAKYRMGHYPPLRMLESVEKEALPLLLPPVRRNAVTAVPEEKEDWCKHKDKDSNTAEPYVDTWSKMAPLRPDRTSLTSLPAVACSDTNGKELRQTFYTNQTDWGPTVDRKSSRHQTRVEQTATAFGSFVEKTTKDCGYQDTECHHPIPVVDYLKDEANIAACFNQLAGYRSPQKPVVDSLQDIGFVSSRNIPGKPGNVEDQWQRCSTQIQTDMNTAVSLKPSSTTMQIEESSQIKSQPNLVTTTDLTGRNHAHQSKSMLRGRFKTASSAFSIDGEVFEPETTEKHRRERRRRNALITGFKPATTMPQSKACDMGLKSKQSEPKKKNHL